MQKNNNTTLRSRLSGLALIAALVMLVGCGQPDSVPAPASPETADESAMPAVLADFS
jgi:hypothetical protein